MDAPVGVMSIGLADAYVSEFFATLGVPFAEKALGCVVLVTRRLAVLAHVGGDAGGESRSAGWGFDRNRA